MNGDDTLPTAPSLFSSNPDPKEALLESQESHKYLLAKSYFDCREFERCSAVFLPSGIPKVPLSRPKSPATTKSPRGKGKQPRQLSDDDTESESTTQTTLPKLSQKALFLALYAKYMAGEKRKDEESEMILGPADRGSAINMELVGISKTLDDYFSSRGPLEQSGGWLEYLYGIVLAKNKIDADARQWLIRSITLFPYNWGAWLELNSLIGSIEEVCLLSLSTGLSSWQVSDRCAIRSSERLKRIYHRT